MKSTSFISEIQAGGVVGTRGIGSSSQWLVSLAGGPDGKLFVYEWDQTSGDDRPNDTIYELVPGSDDGGGGKPPKKPKN